MSPSIATWHCRSTRSSIWHVGEAHGPGEIPRIHTAQLHRGVSRCRGDHRRGDARGHVSVGTELDRIRRAMITGLDAMSPSAGAASDTWDDIPAWSRRSRRDAGEEADLHRGPARRRRRRYGAVLLGAKEIPPTLMQNSRKPNPAGWVPTSSVGNSSSSTIPRSVETARPTAMRTGSTTSGSSRRYAMRGCRP